MQFLVEIAANLPQELREPGDKRRIDLLARELDRGRELRRDGTIERIWRIPGSFSNVGIWAAEDATALHASISSLPLHPWLEVAVTPLATHPVETESR